MVALIATISEFVPVVNVFNEFLHFFSAEGPDPEWWVFALKAYETTLFLQLILPRLEKLSKSTATKWDDSFFARIRNVLAFGLEIFAAIGAVDPKFKARMTEKRTPR